MFDYNIFANNSKEHFFKTCTTIEKHFPNNRKRKLLIDVDGTAIQIYYIDNKEVTVYNDYEVGAVYVTSELDLKELF